MIHADGGTGNDTIVVDKGVLSPVVMDGGPGSDTLIYDGSGGATITGGPASDPGADVIIINPDAGGTIVVNAGGGNAYIVDNSSDPGVVINGGSGNDSITGGYGAGDVLNGGAGNDVIVSRGPSDHIDGGSGDDTIVVNMPSTGFPTIVGGAGNDSLAITATSGADTMQLSKSGADVVVAETAGPVAGGSITASGIESVSIALGGGADTINVGDLQDTTVTALTINVGAGDHVADAVTINGGAGADTFTLSGNDPSTGIQIVRTVAGDSSWLQQIYVQGTQRSGGDTLTVNGNGGDDLIDASLLGSSSTASQPDLNPVDLVALTITGGTGNDRLIGSPFADVIDGGTGTDTLTGGLGLDVFRSENPTAIDILVETQNVDMGLYGNTFITGVALANTGSTPYAQSAGALLTEDQLATAMADTTTNNGNPSFRQPGYGENWQAGATVESIAGIFASVRLTGGDANNTMVVNAIDGSISVGGVARTVTTWNGTALLDAGANVTGIYPQYYVLTIVPGSTAGIDVVSSGGGAGVNDVVVFGSNQADTVTLNATGAGSYRVGFVQASVTATESISYQGVQRLELYLLGGNDSVLSNDTAVPTVIDMGSGDDSIVVGTVPLKPDPGNRTLEYPNGVPVADTAHMTNGNSTPLYVLGGTQNDYFEVNHNVGALYLAGDAGDDTFLINTFLVLKQNPDKPDEITNLTTLFGGTGSNRYQYLQNAPVSINGGSGFDTIIVVGTPIDDTFIVTNTYIVGAGRLVNFTGIESIEIQSGGGNDTIWILSTKADLKVTVDGGSGDDTIHIGGTPPPIVYQPPPTIYQPPSYTVITPELHTVTVSQYYGAYVFALPLVDWIAFGGIYSLGGNADEIANTLLQQRFGSSATITHGAVYAGYDWNLFDFGILPGIYLTVTQVTVSHQVQTLELVSHTVTPPPVTVTSPPIVLMVPASVDASQVKSQVVIVGGDQYQTNGDTVVYDNTGGPAGTGQLVQRTVPRMIQSGENDVTGQQYYTQDSLNGQLLTDTYLSLEGAGLGIDSTTGQTAYDTTTYYGVEMQGIEHVQIRLSNQGSNTFSIADSTCIPPTAGRRARRCPPRPSTSGAARRPTRSTSSGSARRRRSPAAPAPTPSTSPPPPRSSAASSAG